MPRFGEASILLSVKAGPDDVLPAMTTTVPTLSVSSTCVPSSPASSVARTCMSSPRFCASMCVLRSPYITHVLQNVLMYPSVREPRVESSPQSEGVFPPCSPPWYLRQTSLTSLGSFSPQQGLGVLQCQAATSLIRAGRQGALRRAMKGIHLLKWARFLSALDKAAPEWL